MPSTLSPALGRAIAAHEAATDRTGAHLADYSFRFDADAPAAPSTRPLGLTGDDWTLAQTLQEIRLRRASVVRSTRGLKLRHAHLLADLDRAVRRHSRAVGLWIDLGRPTPQSGWDDETALHAAWLRDRLGTPATPVALRPGVAVTDWDRFSASVAERLADGPDAPTAEGVRRDLADLFAGHARTLVAPDVRRIPARAA